MTVTMTKVTKELKEGTKTVFQEVERAIHKLNMEQYCAIVEAKKFFSFFGKEYYIKGYTKAGYIVNRILQTSPNKKTKIEMRFTFE